VPLLDSTHLPGQLVAAAWQREKKIFFVVFVSFVSFVSFVVSQRG
jgi:hypothetical protein